MRCAFLIALLCSLPLAAYAGEPVHVNEQDPTLVFEKRYASAANAVLDKNWVDAHRHFEAALAALGQRDHIKKQTAQILLKKAADESKKQRALFTANELLRLQQFKEAEEAFLTAQADMGDLPEIRKGLDDVRIARENEPKFRAQREKEKELELALNEARMQAEMRQYEAARAYVQRARALNPDDERVQRLQLELDKRAKAKVQIGEFNFDDAPPKLKLEKQKAPEF